MYLRCITCIPKYSLRTIGFTPFQNTIQMRAFSGTEYKSSRYQQFKPGIKDCVTVELKIGKSKNIPFAWLAKYSLKVVCSPKICQIDSENEQETKRVHAREQPNWNENFTFHIEKSKFLQCSFDFTLKSKTLFSSAVDTKTSTMGDVLQNQPLTFKSGEQISVYANLNSNCIPDVQICDASKLCDEESIFFTKRRTVVKELLAQEFPGLNDMKDVPNIAVIGSGGGLRAVIGMSGALSALEEEHLFDYTMYCAGVSGSAWYFSTLYAIDDKNINPKGMKEHLKQSLPHSEAKELYELGVAYEYAKQNSEDFSLTDYYGTFVGDILLGEKSNCKWSDQKEKLKEAKLPLPLLTALHVRDDESSDNFNEYVEMSPYEVFMPKYGTGIDMKYFGRKFENGFVSTEHEELPLSFIQGICGSAYGALTQFSNKSNKQIPDKVLATVPNWLYGLNEVRQIGGVEISNGTNTNDVLDNKNPKMMLTDAGIMFNSPYPLILNPARNIDLILSFEFSEPDYDHPENWPFGELEKAAKWAKNRQVPFPNLDKGKEGPLRGLYVFESPDSPTVLHFVMLDKSDQNTFQKGVPARTKKKIFDKYYTMQFAYSDDDIDWLSELVASNVKDNSRTIRKIIAKAIKNRTSC